MQVQRWPDGLFLSQCQYMQEILDRAGMATCKPYSTLVDTCSKVSALDGAPVCLHMHDPRVPHLAALKRILRYIRGNLHLGLLIRPSAQFDQVVYSDADWAGYPDTRKSTSGYAVFLGDSLVSPGPAPKPSIYRGVANAVAEASWLRQLLCELHSPPSKAILVYCDNNAIYISSNPVSLH
ncbi:uncharacterized mitochondrial protein AtMg00810-like [Miscanthus floridulus]|uniref:uncharacterized mitochondrial protein AtMg00810-like n=1 Tax=Miscanthus floridulus TaxID=154761 RepID=UPI003457AD04